MNRPKPGRKPMEGATPGEFDVARCFWKLSEKYGESPSAREVAEKLGISTPVVHDRMVRLKEKGFMLPPMPWRLTQAGKDLVSSDR